MKINIKNLKERVDKWWSFNSPPAATWDGWDDFKGEFKAKAPVRYFFSKVFPKYFNRPRWAWERVLDWFRYRIVRYHIVDSGLEPGYYDSDHLMLHVNFNILKEFVEVEKAWMQACTFSGGLTWYMRWIPYYSHFFFRDREAGIKHLLWETDLDRETPERDKDEASLCVSQAAAAREVLSLYLWWVDDRPARKEPEYPLELVEFDKTHGNALSWMSDRFTQAHPLEHALYKKHLKESFDCEEIWNEEDTVNLIRLVKIRDALWT